MNFSVLSSYFKLFNFKTYFKTMALFTLLAIIERCIFTFSNYNSSRIKAFDFLTSSLYGLRYDLAVSSVAAFLAYFPVYLFSRIKIRISQKIFLIMLVAWQVPVILLHMADIVYFGESNRHIGYEFFAIFTETGDLLEYFFYTYYKHFIIQIAVILGFIYLTKRFFKDSLYKKKEADQKKGMFRSLIPELEIIFTLFITLILVRGGVQAIPMSPLNAAGFLGSSEKTAIALNSIYNVAYAVVTKSNEVKITFKSKTPEEKKIILKNLYPERSTENHINEKPEKYNIIIVFLESWASNKMELESNVNVTPFFNGLKHNSLRVRDMYAGGQRTTEGVYATLCSGQNPLDGSIPRSELFQFDYRCLPRILKAQGYENTFFQGTFHNTVGTGDFVLMLGFDQSYGKEHIHQEKYPRNHWGVQDPDLYDFIIHKMETMKEPYFIGINTCSTHDKVVPPGVELYGNDVEENVLHFADQALKDFVAKIEKDPRFKRTILVLVADHTSRNGSSSNYQFKIPFQIYSPYILKPQYVDRAASQRDIAPTILDALNLPPVKWFTGKTLLKKNNPPYFVDFYLSGYINWIENDKFVQIPVDLPDNIKCFNYVKDSYLKNSIPCEPGFFSMRNNALAFTEYFQSLLHKGKTMDFGSFYGK
jgi:phosphoglycerol transferase MdoB-like AlkP superfamily enzyme